MDTHTDYCDGTCGEPGWQQPDSWAQPPRYLVGEARDQLDDPDAPWCRIHERAWELRRRENESGRGPMGVGDDA